MTKSTTQWTRRSWHEETLSLLIWPSSPPCLNPSSSPMLIGMAVQVVTCQVQDLLGFLPGFLSSTFVMGIHAFMTDTHQSFVFVLPGLPDFCVTVTITVNSLHVEDEGKEAVMSWRTCRQVLRSNSVYCRDGRGESLTSCNVSSPMSCF